MQVRKVLIWLAQRLPKDNDRKVEVLQIAYVVLSLLTCAVMVRPWKWIFLVVAVLAGRMVISSASRWIHRNIPPPVNEVEARFARAKKVTSAAPSAASSPVLEVIEERRDGLR